MRRTSLCAALLLLLPVATAQAPAQADDPPYEVWAIDQSDTNPAGGGTLHVYRGDDLHGRDAGAAAADVVDLGAGAQALCLAQTGTSPRRPHMLAFDPSASYAVISYVATGHVLFMDAASRRPVACIDVGVQAHAAFASPDGSYVLVANQNGKLLQRVATDFAAGTFALDAAATLNLATCVTPSGAPCQDPVLRPDNAPICPVITADSRRAFVTLRGGGLLVVDPTATPMAIVAEYDAATIHPNGCGGVQVDDRMYLNSGGGTAANPLEHDVYRFSLGDFGAVDPANPAPNTPAPVLVYSHDDRGFVDSHGAALTRQGRYLWVGDRAANSIVVVDLGTETVVDEIALAGAVSGDPAPDLMALSPSGNRMFLSLRGPNPLTANVPGVNNAVGSTPGVGVVRVERGGAGGALFAVAPISNVVGGVERADPHAIAVRPL